MRRALKLAVGLLFGLLVFTTPLLHGGERELALVGRAAMFAGIVGTLLVCALKDRQWIAGRAERHARKLVAVLATTVGAVGFYLYVYFRPGIPPPTMFMAAGAAFGIMCATVSAALTLLGCIVTERFLPPPR